MSDNVLSVIPTDPYWQPNHPAAGRAAAIAATLAFGIPGNVDADVDVTWHDKLTVVDCGQNLERIGCPHCGASIDTEWWADLLETRDEDGFTTLVMEVPCCAAQTSLEALVYDWPCGFARFEIALWNPQCDWFTNEEITALADALGRPVRQIMAHI